MIKIKFYFRYEEFILEFSPMDKIKNVVEKVCDKLDFNIGFSFDLYINFGNGNCNYLTIDPDRCLW